MQNGSNVQDNELRKDKWDNDRQYDRMVLIVEL